MDSKTLPLPRILYIEDNDDARALVARLMVGRYMMLEARDPLAGIELAGQAQPDLVLLDLNLPKMNGMEAVSRLRAVLKPGTAVVALSADSDPDMRQRALDAGFSGFLNKPLNIDAFYECISSLLGARQSKLPEPNKPPAPPKLQPRRAGGGYSI